MFRHFGIRIPDFSFTDNEATFYGGLTIAIAIFFINKIWEHFRKIEAMENEIVGLCTKLMHLMLQSQANAQLNEYWMSLWEKTEHDNELKFSQSFAERSHDATEKLNELTSDLIKSIAILYTYYGWNKAKTLKIRWDDIYNNKGQSFTERFDKSKSIRELEEEWPSVESRVIKKVKAQARFIALDRMRNLMNPKFFPTLVPLPVSPKDKQPPQPESGGGK